MNKEQLIEKWEKNIASLNKAICSDETPKSLKKEFTGMREAIFMCQLELKNLDAEPDKQEKNCQTCKSREACNPPERYKYFWCNKYKAI